MNKVFHFDSLPEKYVCDAAVLCCFDHRFDLGFRKFLRKIGLEKTDVIKLAGGAKALASPTNEAQRELVLDQIRASVRLHHTRKVILMVHSDCGAYGGLEKFQGKAAAESAHHEKELRAAAVHLLQAIPELEVSGYFMDFAGVWKVDSEGPLA